MIIQKRIYVEYVCFCCKHFVLARILIEECIATLTNSREYIVCLLDTGYDTETCARIQKARVTLP